MAALFNAHAARVTPQVVRAFRQALPEAVVLVSEDLDQARRLIQRIIGSGAHEVFSGGGDGSATALINLFREETNLLPRFGLLRLGSTNAWARSLGARTFAATVPQLSKIPRPLPTRAQPLIRVEGIGGHWLFPFAGLGWDAQLLNLAPRWTRSRFPGFLFSAARQALRREGPEHPGSQPLAVIERLGETAFRVDAHEQLRALRGPQVFAGPVGMLGVSTIPEHGLGVRAFPFARRVPGHLNLRISPRAGWDAAREVFALWRGRPPPEDVEELFVTGARLSFSRPLPLQLGGEAAGERDTLELSVAGPPVELLDWDVVRAAIRLAPAMTPS